MTIDTAIDTAIDRAIDRAVIRIARFVVGEIGLPLPNLIGI